MAMLAHAFLAVVASFERIPEPAAAGWISLTCNEIHHLFTTLISRPVLDVAHWIRCSTWRRRHQYRAQQGHYQQQSIDPRTMTITNYDWSTRPFDQADTAELSSTF